MSLVMSETPMILWQNVVKNAEDECEIHLKNELESYLVDLLIRYSNKPEVAKQVLAKAFLAALQTREQQRLISLQQVGDQCLLFAGLFPHAAEKRHVNISYFVDMGRSAYVTVSAKAHDLYWLLAHQFVRLMDVLQSIRQSPLLPFEAYEQWTDVGSKRALRILQQYTQATPSKKTK